MRIPVPNRFVAGQIASVICLLLLISSCVTDKEVLYLNDQIVALNKRVEGLSKEFLSVREQQAKGDVELQKMREDMQGVSGRLDENNRLVRRAVEKDTSAQNNLSSGVTGVQARISVMEADVRRLREYLHLEPAAAASEQGPGEKSSTGSEPEPQVPAVKQSVPAVKQTVPAVKQAAPAVKQSVPVVEGPEVSSEQRLYDVNLALYRHEKYEEAITGFKNYVQKYPNSPLADNAQFWVGESHMALKQYEQAILAFQQVIKKYPKGNKTPNAILRQALAFYEIKDKTSSTLLLKKLIKEYPKSNEAMIATEKLKTMK